MTKVILIYFRLGKNVKVLKGSFFHVGSRFSDFFKSSNWIRRIGRGPTSDTVLFSEYLDFLEPIALDTLVRGAWGACPPVRALRT